MNIERDPGSYEYRLNPEGDISESLFVYGAGFYGVNVTKDKFFSIADRGLIPEKWFGTATNPAFKEVCFTVIPDGATAADRFTVMTPMNNFAMILSDPDKPAYLTDKEITMAIILDTANLSAVPAVTKVKAVGYFDPSLYPSQELPGVDTRSFQKAKRGFIGGWHGEARVSFIDGDNLLGITPDIWRGFITKNDDKTILQEWINELSLAHPNLANLPIVEPSTLIGKTSA